MLVGGGTGQFKKGYFVEPTVFADVKDEMTIGQVSFTNEHAQQHVTDN